MADLDLPVVLLSHRGPASFRRTASGALTVTRGAGGLVTALMGLAEHLDDAVWVCAAGSETDAVVAAEHEGHAVDIAFGDRPHLVEEGEQVTLPTLSVRYVEVEPAQHAAFYTVIANPLLWFVQHGLYGRATAPEITRATHAAYEDGYREVNRQFAEAVCEEIDARAGKAVVLLQDYHFYLVGAMVRERCPDAVVSHFVHIPWPSSDGWRVLPAAMRRELLEGLLGCDVVAFHTHRFARNFLACVEAELGLDVDPAGMSVQVGDRTVLARAYPISVDVAAVRSLADSDGVRDKRQQIVEQHRLDEGRRLVVRVDRTDPSKNIVRGFHAFGQLLDEHEELRGQVTFLASLMPSRQDVPEYADYLAAIGAAVAEVNATHTVDGVPAVDLRLQEDLDFAVAAYQLADVLVVNAVNDGMNLVAKEAVLVNERDGVLVLSESTGAHEELGDYAVTVNPFDVAEQADALHTALTMPVEERRSRLQRAAEAVEGFDVRRWLDRQLEDLGRLL